MLRARSILVFDAVVFALAAQSSQDCFPYLKQPLLSSDSANTTVVVSVHTYRLTPCRYSIERSYEVCSL